VAKLMCVWLAGFVLTFATCFPLQDADAQSLTTEADVTAGATTENLRAGATEVRAFGDVRGWDFYSDASWATRRGPRSDAFGAAYPYEPKVSLLELKVEKTEIKGDRLLGVRLGRYRTPFGIYSGSDQGYTGFLRAPLIRDSYFWALSNNYLETGASVVAGTTWLSAEGSAGVASDQDDFPRRGGLNAVIHLQGTRGPWIAGISYIRTRPSAEWTFARGRTEFKGLDLRWMKGGIQLRGEWIDGHPFLGTRTRGGYADVLVHRPGMGPVTAIARIERLDYFAGGFSEFPRRYTVGARIRLIRGLTAEVNHVHQPYDRILDPGHTSLDVALIYSVRAGNLLGRGNR
jgi:hypothetical protein